MTHAWREIIVTQTGVQRRVDRRAIGAPSLEPISARAPRSDRAGPEVGTVVFYMPGGTHEFVLHALDPERLIPKDAPIHGTGESLHREGDQRERNGELREGLGPPAARHGVGTDMS